MTASLASIGPVGWCAIVVGSWTVLAILVGPRIGRICRASNPGEVDTAVDHPPLPSVLRVVSDEDYLADQPTAVLVGAELDRRFFGIVDAETRWFV